LRLKLNRIQNSEESDARADAMKTEACLQIKFRQVNWKQKIYTLSKNFFGEN
jgi:hypothetical protein